VLPDELCCARAPAVRSVPRANKIANFSLDLALMTFFITSLSFPGMGAAPLSHHDGSSAIRGLLYVARAALSTTADASIGTEPFASCDSVEMGLPMNTSFGKRLIVTPGTKVHLSDRDPEDTLGWQKGHAMRGRLKKSLERLDDLQYLLYAEQKHALLIVLQGRDAAGKDGTIRHVMTGMNPQGCVVTPFKQPTPEEAAHDFLWRVHKAVPPVGDVGIFNRSHYEDVLIVRVHNLVPKDVWSRRYGQINSFEQMLAENRVKLLKFFLHISKDEERRRFQKRIDDKKRHWKISEADFAEREYWDDYTKAFEEMLTRCSTPEAPWFVIPSNKKWFRNLAVSHIIAETMEDMKMKFPQPKVDVSKIKLK
jgi:PPK2 family polyphosphate:nucleotide phosphotransferase